MPLPSKTMVLLTDIDLNNLITAFISNLLEHSGCLSSVGHPHPLGERNRYVLKAKNGILSSPTGLYAQYVIRVGLLDDNEKQKRVWYNV